MKPLIRKAVRADAGPIWDIRNSAILSRCTGHYTEAQLAAWTRGDPSEEFADAISDCWHVITVDSEIVATGLLDVRTGQIDAIFVRPDKMRNGLGRSMMAYLESLALQYGLTVLKLDSTLNAAPFYRYCGFSGDRPGLYESPRGISLPCIPMQKLL